MQPIPIDALSDEANRLEEDTLYSSRGHFEAAAFWSRVHYGIGVPMTVIAAAAGGSAIADNLELAAAASIVVTSLSALSVFLNPSDRSHQHHNAGARFNQVRNEARVFRGVRSLNSVAVCL